MNTRRTFLKSTGTACLLAPFLKNMKLEAAGKENQLPKRFVFISKSNGLRPYALLPEGLDKYADKGIYNEKRFAEHKLKDLKLNKAMQPLDAFKEKMLLVQGLSSKVCKGPHGGHFGVYGSYTSGDHAPPRKETVDITLSKMFPAIFNHLAFHGGNKKDDLFTYLNISATGRNTRTPAYVSPAMAFKDMFGSLTNDPRTQKELISKRNVLDFLVNDVKKVKKNLNSEEKSKLDHYLHGFEAISLRQQKLQEMGTDIKKDVPKFTDKYSSEINADRIQCQFELTASALITGLTNVVTLRCDELETMFTGLGDEISGQSVHEIGHHTDIEGTSDRFESDGKKGYRMREGIRSLHFSEIAKLAAKLQSVPEGNGTMLDNTLIFYMSDAGDKHHTGYENMPFMLLGNLNGAFNTGRYINYPTYNEKGHHVLRNLYLTFFQAAGQPRKEYNDLDLQLDKSIDQSCPLGELLV